MDDQDKIIALLGKHARVETVNPDDRLFGSGLNLSSVSYTEFVLDFEETFDVEVDIDTLPEEVQTVSDFVAFLRGFL